MPLKAITSTLVVSVLFFCGFAVASDPPKGYRSTAWGSSPSKGLKKFSGPTSDGLTIYVPTVKKLPPLFDLPVAEEAYSFDKGKFYTGSAWLDGRENFDKMKAALVKVYGPPSFSNQRGDLFKWNWPAKKIVVQLYYQASHSRTTVDFINNAI